MSLGNYVEYVIRVVKMVILYFCDKNGLTIFQASV